MIYRIMQRKTAALSGYLKISSRWRWAIVGLSIFGVALYEFIEHQLVSPHGSLRDVAFYGTAAVFLISYIFKRMDRLSIAYDRSQSAFKHLQMFKKQLAEAQDIQEAATIYLQALHVNIPIDGAQLLFHNSGRASFQYIAGWSPNSEELSLPEPKMDVNCSLSDPGSRSYDAGLMSCACLSGIQDQQWLYRSCYPLVDGNQLIGVLFLYNAGSLNLDADQRMLLHGMTSEFIAARKHHHLHESLGLQRAQQLTVQHRIAKDAHATLGNNLAYLRMKLDQMSAAYPVSHESMMGDLLQLRNVAGIAYKQMRDLLLVLTPERTPNLRSTLTEYSQRVADRAGFALHLEFSGEVRPLAPHNLQRLFLIVREAMTNIEKHAQASKVELKLDWQEDGLQIEVWDDGRGFDPNQLPGNKQLGLQFMREQVAEMNTEIGLTSAVNGGTKISLHVPYN